MFTFFFLTYVDVHAEKWAPQSVLLQTGKVVTTVSTTVGGKFLLKIEKRTINSVEYLEADYLLIASGSSRQVVMDNRLICIFMSMDYIS